jgi:hypothetical protein
MQRRFVWLAVVAIGIGLAVLAYRGTGHAFVRGHVGDVAASMLVYAILGLVWRAPLIARATATLAIAIGVELAQIVWHPRSTAGGLLFGTTFDPWDVAAYVTGVAVAVLWESLATPQASVMPSR